MGRRGTFGYIKNGEHRAWMIQAGSYWDIDNIIQLVKQEMSPAYQYMKKFGAKTFIKHIDAYPGGYMYPEFDLQTGELKGDGDEWEWDKDDDPTDPSMFETDFSPYLNFWIDVDKKTINLQLAGELFYFRYDKQYNTKNIKRQILSDCFEDKDTELITDAIKEDLNQFDFYVFVVLYPQLKSIYY